jgi:peptidoglycan-associated lipoprotein
MKRHTIPCLIAALILAVGCGPKRKPEILTDPGQRPSPGAYPPATATPEPEQPVAEGPDSTAVPPGGPRSEDFSVNDPSGEGGPLEDVRFDYDRAEPSDEARALLEKHGLWLQNHRTAKVTVEGHCDERGTREYNLALGARRASAVKNYLVAQGISDGSLATISYGKERPEMQGGDEGAWSRNRRGVTALQ